MSEERERELEKNITYLYVLLLVVWHIMMGRKKLKKALVGVVQIVKGRDLES